MEALWRGRGEALARIARLSGNQADAKPYRVHPALLDSAFQAMLAAAQSAHGDQPNARGLYLPVSIRRLILWRDPDRSSGAMRRSLGSTLKRSKVISHWWTIRATLR